MSLRTLVPRSIAVAWAATIAVAFVVSLLFSVVAEFRSNAPVQWQDMAMVPIFALMAAAVSAYVSLAIALVFGIPIFYVLRRLGLTSVRAYLFAGAALHGLPIQDFSLRSAIIGKDCRQHCACRRPGCGIDHAQIR
jgi:hypothetical protein